MKLLQVYGDDYSALEFRREHNETTVREVIDDIGSYGSEEWQLKIIEIPDESVSQEFLDFIRNEIQDYDDSKSNTFWMEDEIIKDY